MPNIQFLSAENEIQKLYSQLGLVVPVGDLSTGKEPSVKPLSTSSTQTSVTASFNVASGADLTALSYTVNNGDAQSITPTKGVVTITLTDLEYNSGPYAIKLTATNETGATNVTSTVALQHYTDWAEPESVLAGNKFIAEGEEMVGTMPSKTAADITIDANQEFVTVPAGYFAEETEVRVYPEPDYFTVEALYDAENDQYYASVAFQNWGSNFSNLPRFFYSFDKENWSPYTYQGGSATTIELNEQHKKVYIYGDNATRFSSGTSSYTNMLISGMAKVYGNILTLMTQNVSIVKSLPDFCFAKLFIGSTGIKDASGLVLPSFVSKGCYHTMFNGCTALTAAPALLPATTLADNCYNSMFHGCTSLTSAPALSATTLANNCYNQMFQDCTSLTSAPELPATTLADSCYNQMFKGCTSLVNAPALPATTLALNCYREMFNGCTALTAAPELPATSLENACYSNMFSGCTGLTSFSGLPATSIKQSSYEKMFLNCTSLTEVEITGEITDMLASYTMAQMFDGCTSLVKITIHNEVWAANRATNWVRNVAATGDFYNLGGATIATGTNGIPSGWTEYTTIE